MTKEKQFTKEQKIEKAKELLTELKALELTEEECKQIAGGTPPHDSSMYGCNI